MDQRAIAFSEATGIVVLVGIRPLDAGEIVLAFLCGKIDPGKSACNHRGSFKLIVRF